MRVHSVALGCQMSAADAEEMAGPLFARGFSPAAEPEGADAIIVNTCTVRQHAEDRALSLIGSLKTWKDADAARVLIVSGCAAERIGPWITKRFPFVDLVVGSKSIDQWPDAVERALAARLPARLDAPLLPPAPVSSYLTVMRGCNYSCSYCIVPAVRGRESYRSGDLLLAEAAKKAAAGARELVLLGQTVNSWRGEIEGRPARFADLLRAIAAIPELRRLRFMSPHPHFVDDALIEAMASEPKIAPQLHLPAQSGSDRILKAMKRNYTSASFIEKASRVRAAVPGVELSTDIIVGFPSETREDFGLTLRLVSELRPSWSYTFKYSPREGTESAELEDDVTREEKEERLTRLNELCDRLTENALTARVGRTVEVLDEQGGFGRTADGFKTRWTGRTAPGELLRVRIADAGKRVLTGECDER